jgi:hypothetical protein
MAGFFKSIFRTGSQKPEQPLPTPLTSETTSSPDISTASFQELLSLTQTLTGNVPLGVYLDLSKRLYEIALLDENVSERDRASAWKLAEAAHTTVKNSLEQDPLSLASLKDARQGMIDQGKRFGYGSLVWKMKRDSIPPGDYFRYAMLPENRPLLGPYLEAVFSDGSTSELRLLFIQELIWQSSYKVSNAVLILHGLAAKRDEALCQLFSDQEYESLLRVPEDYDSARLVLANLGLLPNQHGAKPFQPITELRGHTANILQERFKEADTELSKATFSESEKDVLSVAARFLFMDLAASQLTQIFDADVASEVFAALDRPDVAEFRTLFSSTHEDVYRGKLGSTALDTVLVYVVMNAGNSSPLSEEEFERSRGFLVAGTEWLNKSRVQFLEYFRFMLRALSNPMPKIESDVDREVLSFLAGVYRDKGARSSIAENAMNFEDWIGEKGNA